MAFAAAGRGIELSGTKEGKIDLVSKEDGLLTVNVPALYKVNEM